MRLARFLALSACGLIAFNATAVLARRLNAPRSSAQKQNAIIVVTPEQKTAPDQKAPTLADFSWLAGRWEGTLGAPSSPQQLTAEQEWMAPQKRHHAGFLPPHRQRENHRDRTFQLPPASNSTSAIFLRS